VNELQGIARITFHEGKLEEFKRVTAQCMGIVRAKDTGTLQYDVYLNDDQSECIVRERSLRRAPSPACSSVSRAQSSKRC
jgi:quinol monooxygenase YgiN